MFPNPSGLFSQPHGFSLPTQRCFLFTRKVNERRRLFSAYAEVFLPRAQKRPVPHPFLCLRRGVSQARIQRQLTPQLFSAYAEVFLRFQFSSVGSLAFLCLRRGVSEPDRSLHDDADFSLPTQRCFPDIKQLFLQPILFSAYAEMFPSTQSEQSDVWAFLCLHRGVS